MTSNDAMFYAAVCVIFTMVGGALMLTRVSLQQVVTLDMRCYTRSDDGAFQDRVITIDKEFGGILRLETMNGVCIPAGVIPNDGRQ